MSELNILLTNYVGSFLEFKVKLSVSDSDKTVKPLYFRLEDFKKFNRNDSSKKRLRKMFPKHDFGIAKPISRNNLLSLLESGEVDESNIRLLVEQIDKSQTRERFDSEVQKFIETNVNILDDRLVIGTKGSPKLNTQIVEVYFFEKDASVLELEEQADKLIDKRYWTKLVSLKEALELIKNRELTTDAFVLIKRYYSTHKITATEPVDKKETEPIK